MNKILRNALTGSAITGTMLLIATPAQADSVCVFGATTLPGPSIGVDCTDPNGNGHTEVGGTTFASGALASPTAVVVLGGGGATTSFTTGYIESTTAGRGVLSVTSDSTLLYTGTGSTLVGQATATGATTLALTGTSVTFTSGTLSALGAGSTALSVTATGGAGLGAIDGTINGVITSAGPAIVLNSTNVAATGNIRLETTTGSNVTAGAGDAINITNAGTGSVTVIARSSISANGGDAIDVNSTNAGAGAINITTTAGQPIRASGGDGISVDTNGTGLVTVTNAAAITSGVAGVNTLRDGIEVTSDIGSISIINTGAIGTAGDRAQDDGLDAQIFNALSAGNISVTGTGAIFSVDEGILAETFGTGTVTVNYSGAIDSTGGSGIEATTTTGALNVTSGAITTTGGNAITANSTTGNQILTNNGAINANAGGILGIATTGTITANVNANITSGANGVTLTSGGAKIVNVAAAATVNSTAGNDIAFNGAGTGTVNNLGTIGGDTLGVAVAGPGSGAITVNNGSISNSTAVINGRLTLSANNDLFNNRAVWNTQGTTDFGAGADTLVNFTSGVINILGNTTFANLETFTQNGRINLNTFTLTGSGVFTNNASGFIDTNGSAGLLGFTAFNNAGTLDLAAGTFTAPAGAFTNSGTIFADEGATTITGQTSFANSGIIDLQDGVINDTLTIVSSYNGLPGARLQVDTSNVASDLLVLTGAVSGSTAVDVFLIGATSLTTNVRVVDTSVASINAFIIGDVTGAANPLIDYSIELQGQDYFLVAAPNDAAFGPVSVNTLALDMWYQSANEVFAQTRLPVYSSGFGAWGQIYGSIEKSGRSDDQIVNGDPFESRNKLEASRYGIQAGADFGLGLGRIGLTGGWEKADSEGIAGLSADGWNIGVYGMFGGETGFHGEALFKYDRYDIDFDAGPFDGISTDGRSTGGDIALGYRFGTSGVPIIDVNAGLSHVQTRIDDIAAFGFAYDYDKLTSTRARGGVRAYFGGGWLPYLDGTVYHEFDGDGDVTMFSGGSINGLNSDGKGTWVRVEGGLAGSRTGFGPMLAVWAEAGDRRGAGIRAGFRFGGAAEPMAPPPPPPVMAPPPPPPPATQTCPDGSVILATDMCPPPPPPPPPMAEPERG